MITMKKFIITIGCFLYTLCSYAQQEDCYSPSRKIGIEYLKKFEYLQAKKIFENIHYCPDKPEVNDISTWLEKCNEGLNPATNAKTLEYSKRLAQYEQHFMDYSEGLMAVYRKDDIEKIDKEGNIHDNACKIGFIDEHANLVIPCIYEDPDLYSMSMGYYFSEGLAAVIKRYPEGPLSIDESGRIRYGWGFIDKKGNEIIPFKLYDAHNFSEGLAAVQLEYHGGWCFIDKTGRRINNESYYWAGGFQEGMCIVKPTEDSDGYGFINSSGKLIIPAIYKEVRSFENGTAAVFSEKNGYEAALINKQGYIVGDYTFRPEYLSYNDISIYSVDKYNEKNYDKCFMAILGYEKKMLDNNRPLDEPNSYKLQPFMKGMILLNGWGSIEKNSVQGFEALQYAKESNGYFLLAWCYYHGVGTTKDYVKCMDNLKKAIKANNWTETGYYTFPGDEKVGFLNSTYTEGYAQYMMGLLYYEGKGIPVDYAKAKECFIKALADGQDKATDYLQLLKSKGY